MLKQIAWSMLKPLIQGWLRTRAMVVPVAKRAEIARKFGVSQEVVVGINGMLIDQAISMLDTFKP